MAAALVAMIVEAVVPQILAFILAEIQRRQVAGLDVPTETELRILLDRRLSDLVEQADDFLRSKGVTDAGSFRRDACDGSQ